jgi:hypothetical protein
VPDCGPPSGRAREADTEVPDDALTASMVNRHDRLTEALAAGDLMAGELVVRGPHHDLATLLAHLDRSAPPDPPAAPAGPAASPNAATTP